MNNRRDYRASKATLFDSNDSAINSLQDRVIFLKRLTGDIHEEVESHNHMLDRMGNEMDASRGIMSGTIDRFKMVSGIFHVWLKLNFEASLMNSN
ncbi:hypothetical protein ACSBR1_031561 [Camellia fascicularis]